MRAHAAAALLLLAFVACGGGLSRGELVAEGDKICKRVNDQIGKEPEPKSVAELESLAKKTVSVSDPAIKDMQALEPPDDLEDDFALFVASLKEQRDLTARIGEAAADRDVAKIQEIGAAAERAQGEYREVSRKIGFKECGGGS